MIVETSLANVVNDAMTTLNSFRVPPVHSYMPPPQQQSPPHPYQQQQHQQQQQQQYQQQNPHQQQYQYQQPVVNQPPHYHHAHSQHPVSQSQMYHHPPITAVGQPAYAQTRFSNNQQSVSTQQQFQSTTKHHQPQSYFPSRPPPPARPPPAHSSSSAYGGSQSRLREKMLEVLDELMPGSGNQSVLDATLSDNPTLYNQIKYLAEQKLSGVDIICGGGSEDSDSSAAAFISRYPVSINLDRARYIVSKIEELSGKLSSSTTQDIGGYENALGVSSALKNIINTLPQFSRNSINSNSLQLPSILSGTLPLEPSAGFLATLDSLHACRVSRQVIKKDVPSFNLRDNLTVEKKRNALFLLYPTQAGGAQVLRAEDGTRCRNRKELDDVNKRINNKKLELELGFKGKKRPWYAIIARFIDRSAAEGSTSGPVVVDAVKKNASYKVHSNEDFLKCAISRQKFIQERNTETGEWMFVSAAKLFVTKSTNSELFNEGIPVDIDDAMQETYSSSSNRSSSNSSGGGGDADLEDMSEERIEFRYVIVQLNSYVESKLSEGRIVSFKEAKARYEGEDRFSDTLSALMRVESALLKHADKAARARDEDEKGQTLAGERVLVLLSSLE